MKLNFNEMDVNVVDTVVPAGKYRMRVKGFEHCVAKTGAKQLRCDLEVLDHPEFDGMDKREYFQLETKCLWKLMLFIKAVTDIGHLEGNEVEIESIMFEDLLERCVGETLFINYGVEEFEGLERNFFRRFSKVRTVSPEKEA